MFFCFTHNIRARGVSYHPIPLGGGILLGIIIPLFHFDMGNTRPKYIKIINGWFIWFEVDIF
jgi:hypothetical protein